jgi:hypothetical protein
MNKNDVQMKKEKDAPGGYPGLDKLTGKLDPKVMPIATIIENRKDDPTNPAVGQIWLRTDL